MTVLENRVFVPSVRKCEDALERKGGLVYIIQDQLDWAMVGWFCLGLVRFGLFLVRA